MKLLIPGFNGFYKISNLTGRVWSCRKVCRTINAKGPWRLLKVHRHKKTQHISVSLSNNGHGSKKYYVHRLVLETFIGPCPEGKECRHMDGDPTNNALTNLKWGTRLKNMRDKQRHGTNLKGEDHPGNKYQAFTIKRIKSRLNSGETCAAISRSTGIPRTTISSIKSGRLWGHL